MIAATLWSIDALLRRNLYTIPVATLIMLEHLLGLIFLLPFLPGAWKEYKKLNSKDWLVLVLTSVISGVLGTFLYTKALFEVNYISYSVVVLLQKTQPIFAIALAAMLLKEKITSRYVFLATLGIIAAYFLSFPNLVPKIESRKEEILAALMALGAAACWGSATALSKFVLNKIDFMAATIMRFAIVIPTSFLFAIAFNQTYPISSVTWTQWQYFLGIVFSSGTFAYLLYYKGLQYTPAKISTFAELMYPVSAILIGYTFLNEKLTIIQMVSAILLLLVIFTLSFSKEEEKKE